MIRLKELQIQNFKGIKDLKIVVDGKDAVIKGDNATGKTSVKDAYTWLLFGKNSLGATDFGIKPTDSEGNVIHHLVTKVIGIFDIDGTTRSLTKSLEENWVQKRGSAEVTYKGDSNSFYIDDVPKMKKEYTAYISTLIDEDVFKMITDPAHFNERMKWVDRRATLMSICGEIEDLEILSTSPEFEPLIKALDGRKVEEHKLVVANRMKPIATELKSIPIKIQEAELAKPSLEELEYDKSQYNYIIDRISQKEFERANVLHGAEVTKKQQEISNLNLSLANLSAMKDMELELLITKLRVAKDNVDEDKRKMFTLENTHGTLIESKLKANADKKAKLAEEWDKVFAEEFKDDYCPTCKRKLPDDEIELHKASFNQLKASKLDKIEMELKTLNEEKFSLLEKQKEVEASKEKITNSIKELEKLIEQAESDIEARIEQFSKEKAAKATEIESSIEKLKSEVLEIQKGSQEIVEKIDSEISMLNEEKNTYDTKIANKAILEKQEARISTLKEQEKNLSIEYAELERQRYLMEQFTITKAQMLNDKINSNFSLARFKLFEIQINEGIKETCEVTYNGIPYQDLNNAMKINIGLDVINTLCKKYEVQAPIFIDNAESVTKLFDTYSQIISLVVDENHKQLNIETKEN